MTGTVKVVHRLPCFTWNTSCFVHPKPGNNPATNVADASRVGRMRDASTTKYRLRNQPWTAWMNEYRFGDGWDAD